MRRGKPARDALSVLQRITEQQRMLAKVQLFESVRRLRTAEEDERALGDKLNEHHRKLSEDWRVSAAQALRNALDSLPYQSWLKSEIERSAAISQQAQGEVNSAMEHEAALRGEEKLLGELALRRWRRVESQRLSRTYKDVDEMVLLRQARQENDE